MKLLYLALISVLCTVSQAISISSLATVSLTLASLNTPVLGFFGMFRRRKSPVQEAIDAPKQSQFVPGQPAPGGFFQPFRGFGGNGYFFPGFNTPSFGMFGQNTFPPQLRPPQQMSNPQLHRPQPHFPPSPMQQPMRPPQMPQAFLPQQQMQQSQFHPQFSQEAADFDMNGNRDSRGDEEAPGMNTEEAESFFTLLAETDESKCISRLVCEMGSNPESGGEFGQTIVEIIGSLNDFPAGSKVSEYNEVLNIGLSEGLSACMSKFSACDEESYQLVRKSQADDEGQK